MQFYSFFWESARMRSSPWFAQATHLTRTTASADQWAASLLNCLTPLTYNAERCFSIIWIHKLLKNNVVIMGYVICRLKPKTRLSDSSLEVLFGCGWRTSLGRCGRFTYNVGALFFRVENPHNPAIAVKITSGSQSVLTQYWVYKYKYPIVSPTFI